MSLFNESISTLIENLKSLNDFDKKNQFKNTRKVLSEVYRNGGSLIFCGIGKSGYIGKKSAATFSSLGFKSYFLHPSEAMHGDLGCIGKNDVVFFISNSGVSEELLSVAFYCKINKINSILITSSKDSELCLTVKHLISIKSPKEIFSDISVPTGSVVNFISFIDILSLYFAQDNNISVSSFKKFHPSGKIGHDLMCMKNVVKKNDSLVIEESVKIHEFIKKYISLKEEVFVLIDSNSTIKGVFNVKSLSNLDFNQDLLSKEINEFVSHEFCTVNFNILKKDLNTVMISNEYKYAILLDDMGCFFNVINLDELYENK